ncbi:protein FAR1-RELATED SEQUENCE 9-like [Magnolia sinica]|uniref:protein FAR1-RELATED SEQUENCE 9-like n=1 Tax=Magnolia sinica TaxID=86752 RepID=UPI00265A06A0|nr:protein FAR1-RELATED SEQUENCE 9-like [Magnolia sinica]XP_058105486.1 protein FAR1-RELATED SEQUENCE 9-like [Magnolia sinica]XP_058105487.1 protein FAR1-RELATED SEQUENCE 9-like [Magnolia sinica]XP_058105488.1 protein FAR1-RELATED SEQUENCE 9-like [Magnolia sinica]
MLSWMAPQMKVTDWRNAILSSEDESAECCATLDVVPHVSDENVPMENPVENPPVEAMDDGIPPIENPTGEPVDNDDVAAENAAAGEPNEPAVGMEFASEEDAKTFYKEYAKREGFVVRTSSFYCSKLSGEKISRELVCSKQGHRKSSETRIGGDAPSGKRKRKRMTKRTGCKAMVTLRKQEKTGKWLVVRFHKEHNHPLGPNEPKKARPDKIVPDPAKKAKSNRAKRARKAASAPKEAPGGPSNAGSGDIIAMNYVTKTRRWNFGRDAQSALEYFKQRQDEDPDFFYATEVDDKKCLTKVFWVDGRSRMAYEYFGDVVTFDTRYRTNRFQVPFAPFMGVNHHMQPVTFGCALLVDESTSTLVWLFKTWLTAMNGRQPISIITDRDKTIRAAVVQVFPEVDHRFCLRHINRKRNAKLPHAVTSHPYFDEEFQRCIHAGTIEEFESSWDALVEKYMLRENEWIKSLYEDRQQWVPVYLQDKFFPDVSTAQQSESATAFFDRHMNANTTLKDFITRHEEELNDSYEREAHEDYLPVDTSPTFRTRSTMEKQAANIYTRKVFEVFQEELLEECNYSVNKFYDGGATNTFRVARFHQELRAFSVTFNVSEMRANCSCKKFETLGILCRHVLAVFRVANVFTIPSHYILKRWTKNAKSGSGSDQRGTEVQATVHEVMMLRYNILCREIFKCAEDGTLSIDVFNAAMNAIQDTVKKTVSAKQTATRVERVGTTANGSISLDIMSGGGEAVAATNQLRDPEPSKTRSPVPRLRSAGDKSGRTSTCSLCKGPKHNIRSCPLAKSQPDQENAAISSQWTMQNTIPH